METFTGHNQRSVVVCVWIDHINADLAELNVPEDEHLTFALNHFSDSVQACVMSLTDLLERISEKSWDWTWAKVQVALKEIEKQIKQGGSSTEEKLAKAASVLAVGATAFIAGPALLTAGLGAIGFSAVGPVAGSIAAGVQSVFYGGTVGAGSLFALCQSLTMGGAGATAVIAGLSGVGGIAGATVKEITSKKPSTTWEDGVQFRPSIGVIKELLKFV